MSRVHLAENMIATGYSRWMQTESGNLKTWHVTLEGTGALTATVAIEVSNDGVNPVSTALYTFTLSGNDLVSEGKALFDNWVYYRAYVSALTGTDAKVNLNAGV